METNNMNIRERFEEIWPVPDIIFWSQDIGRYAPMPDEVLQYERLNEQWAHEHNARLDTFTRCQETTDVYVSLIEEMECELEYLLDQSSGQASESTQAIINRAKELLGR